MTNSVFRGLEEANRATAEWSLEFGRFRVLLRQRLLLADGVPTELGTRAFELLLALLEANASLVSKQQLLARVWPGIAVTADNVKVQVFKLRSALGEDRHFIRTESGRGYRFIAAVRSTSARSACRHATRPRYRSTRRRFPQPSARGASHGWSIKDRVGRHFDSAGGEDGHFLSTHAVQFRAAVRSCEYSSPHLAFTPKHLEAEKSDAPVHQ
jgi:DNA-binding winged helix-turn-helix (wHTH) protein